MFDKFAFITGDVHHPLSKDRWDQREIEFASEYSDIIEEKGAKSTLFLTGKLIEAERKRTKALSNREEIEIGGHTYSAFRPKVIHKAFRFFLRNPYGPKFYQKNDINKTINAFSKINKDIHSWRTHCYRGNRDTYDILKSVGINTVSDQRLTSGFGFYLDDGLLKIPINTPTDECISPSRDNENYKRDLWKSIDKHIAKNESVVLQLHPKRQKMLDQFKTLSDVIERLQKERYTFLKIKEAKDYLI